MGELRCVDGSVLSVTPVACCDRAGQPYEITLSLARDSLPFAAVGQRCGHRLARLAAQVTAARQDPGQAACWPDPDDRFPSPDQPGQPPTGPEPVAAYLPGEAEYFSLRSRDRVDLPGSGELRCVLRSTAVWNGECAGLGRAAQSPVARRPAGRQDQWQLSRRAVIEAWGAGGIGVRAVLTSAELVAFLDTVLTEPDGGVQARPDLDSSGMAHRQQPGGAPAPYWRQRGRVPDGVARSRLPALRAQARGGAVATGDSQACRGDVRW